MVGCCIARELSRYEGKILLLEKECDVAMGTSGRNSGVDHAGFYVSPDTLKAELNVEGHRRIPTICKEVGAEYIQTGKLVVAKREDEIPYLEELREQGERNGTPGLEIIGEEEIRRIEPNIQAKKALYSPTSGIMDPFQLTIGLAENALMNGAEIKLNTEVTGINPGEGSFRVNTSGGVYETRYLVNSAGLYADRVSGMAGVDRYHIYPCRGEYHVLDKRAGSLLNTLVYPVPPRDSGGLGVHLTPTVDGNILLGPSADYIQEVCDVCNTSNVMEQLYVEASEMLPSLRRGDFIRSFSGIRPKLDPGGSGEAADFVVREEYEGFINLVGIESPGLTAAPAIADRVLGFIGERERLRVKKNFNPLRKGPVRFSSLSDEEKASLIERNPDYGKIVCRCETVTRKEVLDALNNPLGARSMNSVKVRCRASMGRCQGGFCWPRIIELMDEQYHPGVRDILLSGSGSGMFVGRTKDLRRSK